MEEKKGHGPVSSMSPSARGADVNDGDWVVIEENDVPPAEVAEFAWPGSAKALLQRRWALRNSGQRKFFAHPVTGEQRTRSASVDSSASFASDYDTGTPRWNPFAFGGPNSSTTSTPTSPPADFLHDSCPSNDVSRHETRLSSSSPHPQNSRALSRSRTHPRRRSTCSSGSSGGPGRHKIKSVVSLWKRGAHPLSLWRRRVFQLMNNRKIYYLSSDGKWHKIDVTKITEIKRDGSRIDLVTPERTYYLDSAESASSEEEIEIFAEKVRAIVFREETKDNFRLAALRVAHDEVVEAQRKYKKEMALLKFDLAELEDACKICLEESANILFLECSHLVCCEGCARKRLAHDATCPICGEPIVKFVRTYTAVA